MTVMPFNFTTFTSAILGFYGRQMITEAADMINNLDNESEGRVDKLAQYLIDYGIDSDEYDAILNIFFDDDEVTEDDWILIRRWLNDEILERLTDLLKAMEPTMRRLHSRAYPTIDDV